jgi:WXXGXW repeat (2 copies)
MKNFVRAVLLIAMLLVTAKAGQAQVSVGIVIGAPPPPRVVAVVPTRPDPASMWVAGYWYPVGHHYKWHEGYWTRPPYEGACATPRRPTLLCGLLGWSPRSR